jgi:hypothetical protein
MVVVQHPAKSLPSPDRFAGCTRRRGRRQPFCRTRRHQVEGEAPDLAEPLGEDGERAGRDVTIFG